jgi:ATP-dependent DNA ligase
VRFDLLMLNGEDLRRKPYVELLRHGRGIQYVEHAEGHGDRLFEAVCESKAWLKIKNPKAPAATRAIDGTF